jgi:hypothetical protein
VVYCATKVGDFNTDSGGGGGASVGTLNTNVSVSQPVSGGESFANSISLHKISKTGNLSDCTDTSIANPQNDHILLYSNGYWRNGGINSVISVSATDSEGDVLGYFAGRVTIDGFEHNFIVNPARPVNSNASSSVYETDQGVIRPYQELGRLNITIDNEASLDGGNFYGSSYPYENVLFRHGLRDSNVVFIPITTLYRLNKTTNKMESIPCLAVPSSWFDGSVKLDIDDVYKYEIPLDLQ